MGLLTKLIHNDAIKQDPPEIYGWRVYALACSACFGGMLFGMDSGIIGGVLTMSTFQDTYGLTGLVGVPLADLQANIVTTLQCGCFVGALGTGFIADKIGRRYNLILAAVMATIGTIMQAAASGEIAAIFVGRFIAGLGVGAASMVTPLYISENAPRAIRGALTGIYQLFITAGIMLAFWINYGANEHIKGDAQYVVPLIMQALPAVLLFGSMWFCHESPRWLARQDRWEEASKILSLVRALPATHPYVAGELTEIRDQLDHERRLIGDAGFKDLMREMWTIPGNRKRALISVGLMICQQMTGTNAINYYAPQIFKNLGLKGTSVGLFATGIYGVIKMLMCGLFLIFAADSLGRRKSLLWTSIAMGMAMMYVGLFVRITPPQKDEPVTGPGYVALVCVYLFASFFQWGWGPVCWIYVSEIPTARLRGLNVSLAAATQWLFNLVIARAVPNMLATMGEGGYGAFIAFSCFCFSMFIFVWFLVPETKGMALEAMDELFGAADRVGKSMDDEENGSVRPASETEKNGTNTEQIEISTTK